MTPYFICYIILIGALSIGLLFDKLRLAAIVAFVPMFLIIALRGLVGTDSAIYVQSFDVIRYRGILASDFELGFTLLVEILSWLLEDSFDILIVLGCATAIILLTSGLLLERSPLLLMGLIFPYFLLDMSMNGLRYGLAFAIVALGAAALARGWLKAFIMCSIIAASIQISAALLAASLWALAEARFRTFLGAGLGLVVAFIIFGDYLSEKLTQNSDISGIGGISGVAPLVATMAIIAAVRLSAGKEGPISNLALFSVFVMQAASFFIAREYYAGLRLQGLFLFLLYLVIVTINTRVSRPLILNHRAGALLLFSIVVLSGSRLKNFNDDVYYQSPFNPYYRASELSA